MPAGGNSTTAAARQELLARRDDVRRLADSGADSRAPVELDQTRVGRLSRMDAMQQQAMALEADRRRTIELHRIEAALKRIEDGEYGYCLQCGGEIAAKRLDLDPTAPLCINCARNS